MTAAADKGLDSSTARMLSSLAEVLSAALPKAGEHCCASPEVKFVRRETSARIDACVAKVSAALVVSGEKRVRVGGSEIQCQAGDVLVFGTELPDCFEAVGASPSRPFLAISLSLRAELVISVQSRLSQWRRSEMPRAAGAWPAAAPCAGFALWHADAELIDAFFRLTKAVGSPLDAAFLGPSLEEEIVYRMLMGPCGRTAACFFDDQTPSGRIAQAIAWMRRRYREPLSVEEAARHANMSTATFYRHFKAVANMSPAQYIKTLRLIEAQRQMIQEGRGVLDAAAMAGYAGTSHFTREFKRMFGLPPAAYAKQVREREVDPR